VYGVESRVPLGALPIHFFKRFYAVATMHSVTDRQTDNIIMPTAVQYDRLKINITCCGDDTAGI